MVKKLGVPEPKKQKGFQKGHPQFGHGTPPKGTHPKSEYKKGHPVLGGIETRFEKGHKPLAIDNGRTLCEKCHRTTDTYGYKINKYAKK